MIFPLTRPFLQRTKTSTSMPSPPTFMHLTPPTERKSVSLGAPPRIISAAFSASSGMFAAAAKSLPVPEGISPRRQAEGSEIPLRTSCRVPSPPTTTSSKGTGRKFSVCVKAASAACPASSRAVRRAAISFASPAPEVSYTVYPTPRSASSRFTISRFFLALQPPAIGLTMIWYILTFPFV